MSLNVQSSTGPGFWTTVRLLLASARRRSVGRAKRQQELRTHRKRSGGDSLGVLGILLTIAVSLFIHGAAAYVVRSVVRQAQLQEKERFGRLLVSKDFISTLRLKTDMAAIDPKAADEYFEGLYSRESRYRVKLFGGNPEQQEATLRQGYRLRGLDAFAEEESSAPEMESLASGRSLPRFLGAVALCFWLFMMIFQGEGLELDLQRRRYPMWEWLFSHPVHPGAVFLAEMASPIASNLIYCTGPLFFGVLYGQVYGFGAGVVAAVLAGIPVSVATACVGKALETAALLRFPPRSRGAILGIMGWLGYATSILLIFSMMAMPAVVAVAARWLAPIAEHLPWPWLAWSIGARPDGTFSFPLGVAFCGATAILMIMGAVWFCIWGARQGLSADPAKSNGKNQGPRSSSGFLSGRHAVQRKEWLWLMRDRGAIVQAILIPLTIAATQLFNFRNLITGHRLSWNLVAGIALVFGTYFLWILGPRSLTSEGFALWIPLTWPRGMEDLLKAKARLWFFIATGLVMTVFAYALVRFPGDAWKTLLAMAGWMAFGLSMAYKSVTLVSVPSSSGEAEPIPRSRRWATSLGMLTFGIGILSQQWHIAVVGIVYSWMTAAALWQNFRARLPFLFDPWSEKLPSPPTLLHAMIAISILVEAGAIVVGISIALAGHRGAALGMAFAYTSCAAIVAFFTADWLKSRGVQPEHVWCWPEPMPSGDGIPSWWSGDGTRGGRFLTCLALGAGIGLILGLLGLAYTTLLSHLPFTEELIRNAIDKISETPGTKAALGFMAIAVAPFVEEYLFRGLLFRALDREWGSWRAIVGSAAFFAIYHPPISWLPVALLGATNAMLFKKTGRLAPAVALHMVYNMVIVWGSW